MSDLIDAFELANQMCQQTEGVFRRKDMEQCREPEEKRRVNQYH